MVVREGKWALASALFPWEQSGVSQSTISWLFCTHELTHEFIVTPTGWAREEQEEAPADLHARKQKKKVFAFTPHYSPIVWALMEHQECPSDSVALPCLPKILPKPSHSHRASKGVGAYGGTEMLNTVLVYLWLIQPAVTTSNNWIVPSIAGLICYLIIKPAPLFIMASLETKRLGEKCIRGTMLMLKTHVALGAEQDLCQMQMLCWRLIKRALCGLLCLPWNIYQLWQAVI